LEVVRDAPRQALGFSFFQVACLEAQTPRTLARLSMHGEGDAGFAAHPRRWASRGVHRRTAGYAGLRHTDP
jgi:hypothetical protein